MPLQQIVLLAIDGVAFGILLFLLAGGLQLIFGFMNIVNLAHGSFFVIGGLVAGSVAAFTGNFLIAILAGGAIIALGGLFFERLISRFGKDLMDQSFITWGLVYILTDLHLSLWGGYPQGMVPPQILSRSVTIMGWQYPIYKLALIGIGLALAFGLWWLQEKTRLGAKVRAGVDDNQMASALGINTRLIGTLVFALGAFLAGLAGGFAAPIIPMELGQEWSMLILGLVVLVVGGVGSVYGVLLGALLIGLASAFAKVLVPEISNFIVFIIMFIVLILRPGGLISRYRREV